VQLAQSEGTCHLIFRSPARVAKTTERSERRKEAMTAWEKACMRRVHVKKYVSALIRSRLCGGTGSVRWRNPHVDATMVESTRDSNPDKIPWPIDR
jgi:hypothetical protein